MNTLDKKTESLTLFIHTSKTQTLNTFLQESRKKLILKSQSIIKIL